MLVITKEIVGDKTLTIQTLDFESYFQHVRKLFIEEFPEYEDHAWKLLQNLHEYFYEEISDPDFNVIMHDNGFSKTVRPELYWTGDGENMR